MGATLSRAQVIARLGDVLSNSGGPAYTSSTQELWNKDYGFASQPASFTFAHTNTITGTNDDALYQNGRFGPSLHYSYWLTPGVYELTLHWAEHAATAPGQRVFDVAVEGALWLNNLDVFAEAGLFQAHQHALLVQVVDGHLDIDFTVEVGQAFVCAIEARAYKVLTLSPTQLDFDAVDLGQSATQNLVLANVGTQPITIDEIAFLNSAGAGHDFELQIGSQTWTGDHHDVVVPVNIALPVDGTITAQVTFTPSEHEENDVRLRFDGDFVPVETRLLGSGGTGDPFLHAVAVIEPYTVDYDQNGIETVHLDGSDSHTHELGHQIIGWTWRENGVPFASGAEVDVDFTAGPHEITLTIRDDNMPPHTLVTSAEFEVIGPQAVPGVFARAYNSANPASLLVNVPTNADLAEVLPGLAVAAGQTIGGSSLSSMMVRLTADYDVAQAGSYAFTPQGGSATHLLVDGQVPSGPVALTAGKHTLDARFAVPTGASLPLAVLAAYQGGQSLPIDPAQLTHDQSTALPVINAMPTGGPNLGGYIVTLEGFGFFPRSATQVVWGATTILESSFLSWTPERVEFLAPAGSGTITVRVQNAVGLSEAHSFVYSPDNPPPIQWQLGPTVAVIDPTCAEWGPDGKLYVGTIGGTIKAITFNENYGLVGIVESFSGVSTLVNKGILGITFSPWDGTSPIRLYVGHAHLFQNGGSSFSGPSFYRGQISVLTGPNFNSPQPVVTNLPNSNHDHEINGMMFDDNGDLLFTTGGNTNAGVKHPSIGDVPESPLSGAICKALLSRPDFNGTLSYVLSSNGQPNNDQVFGEQVDLAGGAGHVLVYASGFRNAYDLVVATNGLVYATDNGADSGFGVASTSMTTEGPTPTFDDELMVVDHDSYHGHPNRSRGRYDPRQAVYRSPNAAGIPDEYTPPIAGTSAFPLPSSMNGITEYRATTFASALRGQLLVQKWNDQSLRIKLQPGGRAVQSIVYMSPSLSSLDVVTGPGGVILGIDYSDDIVRTLLPVDAGASGLVAYDITPWRGPASGGTRFTIGGSGFGNLGNTSVTIGGVPATLISVSAKRIVGTVPANPAAAGTFVNVAVSVGAQTQTMTLAFRYLYPPGQALGFWVGGQSMPQSLGEVACGVINGKLYLVGEGNSNTLAYTFSTSSWTSSLSQRPFPGHHHSAEVFGGKLYLIGGIGSSSSGKVQIYDPAGNSWSTGANMPWAAGSVSSCVIAGKIYVSGGIVGSTTVDNCALYDIGANSWTPLASMPFQQGRNHAAAGTDGQRFYIFGGRGIGSGDGNFVANGFDTTQIYDPATNTWTTSLDSALAPLPQKRGGMGKAVYYNSEFYVIGGETIDGGGGATAQGVYKRVDVYNPVTNTWRLEQPMPTARHGIFPVKFQGRIFVAGGGVNAGGSASSILEIFQRP